MWLVEVSRAAIVYKREMHTLIRSVIGSAVPLRPLSMKYGSDERVKLVACEVRTIAEYG